MNIHPNLSKNAIIGGNGWVKYRCYLSIGKWTIWTPFVVKQKIEDGQTLRAGKQNLDPEWERCRDSEDFVQELRDGGSC